MSNAKPTQGPMIAAPTGHVMAGYSQPYAVGIEGKEVIICGCFGDIEGGNARAKANAELIAEAFNVYSETGLTPRQLADELAAHKRLNKNLEGENISALKQRDELLATLALVESWFVRHKLDKAETIFGSPEKPVYAELPILGTVRQAIANAKGGAS